MELKRQGLERYKRAQLGRLKNKMVFSSVGGQETAEAER